jgi:HlyD family secretion protein
VYAVAVVGVGAVLVVVGSLLLSKLSRPEVRIGSVVTLSPAQADVKLMTTGYVVPMRKATVATKVLARIETINVREGEDVKEGQLLATLEASDVRAQVAEARAALKTTEARVSAAKASLADAKLKRDREQQLFASAAVTRASVEAAESTFEVAAANVEAAIADVATAQARLENAQSFLANTRVVAPFAGRITRKLVEEGEVPAAAAGVPGGVVELVDFASLVVEADVSEGRISQVQLGGPAEITLDAYPTRRLRGEVHEIRPTVDRQKATVLTRVKFIDPTEGVLPQMSARVLLLGEKISDEKLREPAKVVVPETAVTERAGERYVFVVSEGRVRLTPVTVGQKVGQSLEVKAGPAPGTKIVLEPPSSLADGDAVKEKT